MKISFSRVEMDTLLSYLTFSLVLMKNFLDRIKNRLLLA